MCDGINFYLLIIVLPFVGIGAYFLGKELCRTYDGAKVAYEYKKYLNKYFRTCYLDGSNEIEYMNRTIVKLFDRVYALEAKLEKKNKRKKK